MPTTFKFAPAQTNGQVGVQALPFGSLAGYDSNTAGAGASVTCQVPAVIGGTSHVVGFTVTTGPPSSAGPLTANVTLSDGVWTQNFVITETLSAGGWMEKEPKSPFVASAQNTAIVLTMPAVSSGGIVAVEIHGYISFPT